MVILGERPFACGPNGSGPVPSATVARGLPQVLEYSTSSSDNGVDSSLLCGFNDMGQKSDSIEHYVPSVIPHAC